jgi:hypothetical protein
MDKERLLDKGLSDDHNIAWLDDTVNNKTWD